MGDRVEAVPAVSGELAGGRFARLRGFWSRLRSGRPEWWVVLQMDPEERQGLPEVVCEIVQRYASSWEMLPTGEVLAVLPEATWRAGTVESMLRHIQMQILGQTGWRVFAGAGRTKLVATLACRSASRSSVCVIEAEFVTAFLADLAIGELEGTHGIEIEPLVRAGISTIGRLRSLPKPVLAARFGDSMGTLLWNSARGRDMDVPRPRREWGPAVNRAASWIRSAAASHARPGVLTEVAGETPAVG